MKYKYIVKKENFPQNYRKLLSENYKAWYKFIEPGTTLSGFADRAPYYIHHKTGLMRKLKEFLYPITKVLDELCFG